jgi:hypothetical protein
MLQFLKKIPKKLFGKHKKTKNTAESSMHEEEDEVAFEEPQAIISTPETSALQAVDETQVKELAFAEEPPRLRRTRNTAFTRRPKAPLPTVPEPLQTDREEMYNKIQEQTTALQEQKPIEDVVAKESMKDEIVRKAKERRHRTHTHNHYYKGKGKDAYHLEGRELKSVFEDDEGKKLPVDQRQQILRELQKGERKLHFR